MPTAEKVATVEELTEIFRRSKGIYLTDFTGLDVPAITRLRKRLREEAVSYRVIKNRLAILAAKHAGIEGMAEMLRGPTGLVSTEDDPVRPARLLSDFANGAQGVVQASTGLWPGTDVRIEINGADGTAIMTGERMTTWEFRQARPDDEKMRDLGDAAQVTAASDPAAFGFADHQVVIQDMIDAVRLDRDVVIPVRSVRPTLEMVLAMYQSAAHNRVIELPVTDDETIWQ